MRPAAALLGLVLGISPVAAQSVPGRDLLTSPIGLLGVPAALGEEAGGSLWNPAMGHLDRDARFRVGVAALNAPVDVALTGQFVGGNLRVDRLGTVSASLASAGIADLARTDTDPQSIGGDIPYSIWVASLGLARPVTPTLTLGASARWLSGRVDRTRRTRMAGDVGLVYRPGWRDLRVAASTFLLTGASDAPATTSLAADLRLVARDSVWYLRAGVGHVATPGATRETFPFLRARLGRAELRGGPVRVDGFGAVTWRSRLAIVLHQETFTIGVAQEGNSNGLQPTYQIAVTTTR
jgi:hypothetical protein